MHSGLLVRAGMAAVPYLVRQEQWTVSAGMLERAFNEDPSRSNAAAMLPAVQQMASHDPTLASATSARPSVPSPISRMHAATATPRFRCNATRCATPTSGTDLADLLHAISPDPDATDRALRDLIAQAQALAAAPPDDDQR